MGTKLSPGGSINLFVCVSFIGMTKMMSQPGIRWKCYMHQHCAGFVLDVGLDPFKSINAVSKFRKFFQISETRGLSAERDQSNHTESLELAATQTEH